MKAYSLILVLILLLPVGMAFSQELRLVTGTMKDNSGESIPGVNIVIKGTTNGVATDMNGRYSIKAPLGSTLVISYIGFNTREITVTLKNSEGITKEPVPDKNESELISSFSAPVKLQFTDNTSNSEGEGTAVFTSKTPSYAVINQNYNWMNDHNLVVGKIKNIDYNSNYARINLVKDEYYNLPHISFISSFSNEQHNRLPKLQNQYVQGRPIEGVSQWRGPETGEILSWGPNIKNLEFDGSNYAYDSNGRLVSKGTGIGIAAKSYNPITAFQNGYTFTNTLKIFLKTDNKEYSFLIINKLNNGILPGISSSGNNAELKLSKRFGLFKVGAHLNFDDNKSNYLEGSPANSLVMASILTTPISFDLTNNRNARKAYNDKNSYQLTDNTQRSYSPGKVNHPYWLLHNSLDKENQQLFNGMLNLEFRINSYFTIFSDARYQYQENNITIGYSKLPSGINMPVTTSRNEVLYSTFAATGIKWDKYFDHTDINSCLKYDYYHLNSRLTRSDSQILDDFYSKLNYSQSRTEHNLNWSTNFSHYKGLLLKMTHNLSSNNRYRNNKMLYAPTLALGYNFHELFNLYGIIEQIKLRSNWGYSYSNVPMNYAYGKYNLQIFNSGDFYNSSFLQEVNPELLLHPEKIMKKDIGLEIGLFYNKVSLDIDFYENSTTNAIFPVLESNIPELENIASTRVKGIDAEISVYQRLSYSNSAKFRLVFDHFKSKVLGFNKAIDEIPLGGFADVHTSLIKGYPAGVVVGTAWKRDDIGNMIIGDDGYPLVDDKLKVIANPEPDFTLGLETTFNIGPYTTSILFDYRHGGQVWNGTGNVLSYMGLSEKTVEGRKVSEYVFQGVKQDGTINTTPVDFANPSKPLEQNRWYRYGITGVAEDAIENASSFRVTEISLSYRIQRSKIKPECTIFVRNPLLITKYSGVDPNITLWEKSNTYGLDLFNMPSVSSFGISFKVNL